MNREIIELQNMAKQVVAALETLSKEDTEKMNHIMGSVSTAGGDTIKDRLIGMQKDFGDDLFDKIVAGGSLMSVCDRWTSEKIQEMMAEMIKSILTILSEKGFDKITKEHVAAFIECGVNAMGR